VVCSWRHRVRVQPAALLHHGYGCAGVSCSEGTRNAVVCGCMCLQVTGLHSHAAQRLVGLTSSMARRWLKLSQAAEVALQPPSTDVQVGPRLSHAAQGHVFGV